jgi:nitrogen regulatory protein PII
MKRIEVTIKPFELEAVNESLAVLRVRVTTVSPVQQAAPPDEPFMVYRGSRYVTDFVTMLRLEVLVSAERASDVLEALRRSAKSVCAHGAVVLVSDVGEAIHLEPVRAGGPSRHGGLSAVPTGHAVWQQ